MSVHASLTIFVRQIGCFGHVRDALVEELPCSPPWKNGGSGRGASGRIFV